MRPRPPITETVLILLLSGALLAICPSRVYLKLVGVLPGSQFWENHTHGFFQVLVMYGVALLALAAVSYTASLFGTTLRSQVVRHSAGALSALREEVIPALQLCFASRRANISLLLALAMGVGLRGYFLAQPMRYDEAYTFLNFAYKGFSDLFYYQLPNNHVLHTILMKASTLIWGANPASIRSIAFLAGIGLVPLVFCLCRTLGQSGVFAAVAVSVFPYLVSYSTNARGYSLLAFLTLALAFVAAVAAEKPSVGEAVLLSVIAALGMMTIPSMLLPIAGIYCWLACLLFFKGHTVRSILLESLIPCSVMTLAFTMILYTPVILVTDGVESIVANRFVQSQTWREFLSHLYPHLRSLSDFVRDIPWAVLLFGATLVTVGLYGSTRRRDWPTLLLLPSVLVGSVLVFLAQHRIPFARTWIYVIPIFLVTADSGFSYVLDNTSRRIRSLAAAAILVAAAIYGVFLISTNTIAAYPDTGYFPEAPIVAGYLKPILTSNDTVEGQVPADWPTFFYLWYYGVAEPDAGKDVESGATFLVVKKSRYTVQDMTQRPVIKLLELGDMALYRATGQSQE